MNAKHNGFLFIGDPHVSSRRPGRRKDDYVASVLGKLTEAAAIAQRENLLPVILGDLFHRANENDLSTLTRLIQVLKGFHAPVFCLGGNHDKEKSLVDESDALALMQAAGVLTVIDGECQHVLTVDTPKGSMGLWAAPYGAQIPDAIECPAEHTVLITHHDLAFQGAYPGAALLKVIKGCDLVVNGHMHKTTPSVPYGETVWHCPGNIEPLSVDCRDHRPAVWGWTGEDAGALVRFNLQHNFDCFDLTGLTVAAAPARAAVADLVTPAVEPELPSHFAQLLAADSTMEANRTEDEQTFLEDLKSSLDEISASGPVQALLLALANGKADLESA